MEDERRLIQLDAKTLACDFISRRLLGRPAFGGIAVDAAIVSSCGRSCRLAHGMTTVSRGRAGSPALMRRGLVTIETAPMPFHGGFEMNFRRWQKSPAGQVDRLMTEIVRPHRHAW